LPNGGTANLPFRADFRLNLRPGEEEVALAFSDLALVGFLKSKMHWHQGRQRVLAENVANAETPGYEARELKPMRFENHLKGPSVTPVATARTHRTHFTGSLPVQETGFLTEEGESWEVTPEGNAVVLEEQMLKVSENQFDFQLATSLYTRSLGLLRTAIGRNR
jgi:flagellar basal-body rod protein FlgB